MFALDSSQFQNPNDISLYDPIISISAGSSAAKNAKYRKTMEDTHYYDLDFMKGRIGTETEGENGYFGVFDGHAGTMAAKWCAINLHKLLAENISKYSSLLQTSAIIDATFQQADRMLCNTPSLDKSGCTAAIACLLTTCSYSFEHSLRIPQKSTYLYTANLGDSRVVLCSQGIAECLTKDHRADDKIECARVIRNGGSIRNQRVEGVLSVTRAFGDRELKRYVCAHPYTTETIVDINKDEFLILACDGLWDVMSDQEAVDLVRPVGDPKSAADKLIRQALRLGSTDNITCIVVILHDPKFDPISSRIIRNRNQTKPLSTDMAPLIVKKTRKHNDAALNGFGFKRPPSPQQSLANKIATNISDCVDDIDLTPNNNHDDDDLHDYNGFNEYNHDNDNGKPYNFYTMETNSDYDREPRNAYSSLALESLGSRNGQCESRSESFSATSSLESRLFQLRLSDTKIRSDKSRRLRYGARRISRPLIFNDNYDSDAIVDD